MVKAEFSVHLSCTADKQPTEHPVSPIAESLRSIDQENHLFEQKQFITFNDIVHTYEGANYIVRATMPSRRRTYKNEQGEDINYPSLMMVHGVASDVRYFTPLSEQMAKLGIASYVIELPRMARPMDNEELLNWQVGAVVNTYRQIKNLENGDITLQGHSRGAIVATNAALSIYEDLDLVNPSGLLLLAPAGLNKIAHGNILLAIKTLGPLAINSLIGLRKDPQRFRQHIKMLTQVVVSDLEQSLTEISHAINTDNLSDIIKQMPDVPVFIPFAEGDEFIRYTDLLKLVKDIPNVSMVTVESSHLLEDKEYCDLISLADPRILSGQLLNFLMSQTPGYTPKIISGITGEVVRL